MKKHQININDKYGAYTVVSEPFVDKDGYRKVICRCKCGSIRKIYCGNIKRLNMCMKCLAKQQYHKAKPGDKFHQLTVIEYTNKKDKGGHVYIKVKCDCGNITEIVSGELGKTKTCGCILNRTGNKHPSYKGYGFISGTYFAQLILNAKKRKLELTINIKELNDLLLKQNHKCALSGLSIKIGNTKEETTASLDRIDSSKGYELNNIQWIHKDINRMKSDFNNTYFIEICKKIGQKSDNRK